MNRLENDNTTLLNEFNKIKSSLSEFGSENANDLSEINIDELIEQMKNKQKEIKELKTRINEI